MRIVFAGFFQGRAMLFSRINQSHSNHVLLANLRRSLAASRTCALAIIVTLVAAMNCAALAADGDGGYGGAGTGSAPGQGVTGNTGANGGDGDSNGYGGGGGGGGAAGLTVGGNGGNGGSFGAGQTCDYPGICTSDTPSFGYHGSGGVGAGMPGTDGVPDSQSNGGGGGGGGGGTAGNGATGTITSNVTGGYGGTGGTGEPCDCNAGGGGGGGAGGYGAVITQSVNNTFIVQGGNGGGGGAGGFSTTSYGGNAGNGGSGGIGVQVVGTGFTLTNSGSIIGGIGGPGGAGGTGPYSAGANGAGGTGGVGVIGAGLAIINSGTIEGGLSNGGLGPYVNAITFTGGVNSLTLLAGSRIVGNVSAHSALDTFALGGSVNSSFNTSLLGPSAQYQGFGVFEKTGTSTWTLTGTPGQDTPWNIIGGTLKAGSAFNVFGSNSAINVGSDGTLDLGGTSQQIGSLAGGGVVTSSGAGGVGLYLGANTPTTFSGVIQNGSGTIALFYDGGSTFTLTGHNTYSGITNIQDGTLALAGTGSIASSSVVGLYQQGNIFDISQTTNGASIVTLNGVTGSAVNLGSKTLTITNGSGTYSGVIEDGGISGGAGGSLAFSGGNLTLSGNNTYTGSTTVSGGTLTLIGTNSYTGATTISGGTLALGSEFSYSGLANGSIAMSSQVNLTNAGATFDISQARTEFTSLQTTGSEITTLKGVAGSLVNLGGMTLIITNGSTTFAGTIQDGGIGGGSLGSLLIAGGTQTLTGNNTYTGTTTINSATLALKGSGSISSSAVVNLANSTAVFDISQTTSGASIKALVGDVGDQVYLGSKTLTITSGLNTNFAGSIRDGGIGGGSGGSFALNQAQMILSGNNTYTGATTVQNGILLLSGAGSIASSSEVNLTNNGIFDISETTNGTSIVALSGDANSGVYLGSKTLTITQGSTTFAGILSDFGFGGNGAGGLAISGGTQTLSGNNTYTGATTIGGGTLALVGSGSIAASSGVNLSSAGAIFDISQTSSGAPIVTLNGVAGSQVNLGSQTLTITQGSTTFAGIIQDGGIVSGAGGQLAVTGGTQTLSGGNTYTGATTINGGTLALAGSGSIAASSQVNLSNFGAFDISQTSGASIVTLGGDVSGLVNLGSKTLMISQGSTTFAGTIQDGGIAGGSGGGLAVAGGTQTLSGVNSFTGATTISGGTLALDGAGSIAASKGVNLSGASGTFDISGTHSGATIATLAGVAGSNVSLGAQTLTVANGSSTFAGSLQGSGGLTLAGGTETLSGTSSYTGATTVTGGILNVTGAITGSANVTVNGGILNVTGSVSDPTINAGGLLTGAATVGDTTINSGGIFMPGTANMPGSSMTVAGNLAFASGALYVVTLNPTTASYATVTGSATLGGAGVSAIFASGGYVNKLYTILAAGSVSGTFGSLVNTNLPSNFHTSLSYDATHAYLNLALNFTPPTSPNSGGGPSGNQQSAGNAIINFFNTVGSIPLVFGGLTPAGLTQLSGETATGSQQTTFNAMGQFMGVMTDPFMHRGDGAGGSPTATGYAEENTKAYQTSPSPSDAFAMVARAQPNFEQRWSVWSASFGGSQTTDGNATLGSNTATSSVYGTAVGADYRISPFTVAGFALAGGGTSFSVAGGGSGHSDLFQAGAFIRHTVGQAYVTAALAYGWQDITTDRTVTVAGLDQLRAKFNANAFSGRLEGGYRFVTPWMGITPYAAAQLTMFDLPDYSEQAIIGSNIFALAYNARDVTDTRSELGLRTDRSFALPDSVLTLRGRLAWAHDFDPDRSVAATFQALPGASFVVNGAAQAHDSALVTASVEKKWLNGWSVAATFEGEFSDVTSSYAGKGVVRYAW
jgi:autotransporter-associated beta strand protein